MEGLSIHTQDKTRDWVPEATGLSKTIIEEYGLVSALRVQVVRPGNSMELEVLEMLDPKGAFGMFTLWPQRSGETSREHSDSLARSRLSSNALLFWQGNYVFRLSQSQGQLAQESARQFSTDLEACLRLPSLWPVTTLHLPLDDLDRQSLRFYLGPGAFSTNQAFPEAVSDLAQFDIHAEVTFARYRSSEGEIDELFLFAYPTPDLAVEQLEKIQEKLSIQPLSQDYHLRRSGILIGLLLGDSQAADRILTQLNYDPKIEWIYDDRPRQKRTQTRAEVRNFFTTIRDYLVATMLFLVATLGVGVLTGLLRYWFVFNSDSKKEGERFIRLDLS